MIPITHKTSRIGIETNDVYSDEFSNRRIYLTGKIDEYSAADVCAQINHLSAQSHDDIYIIIQSPGGSVSAGMAILDAMNASKCDVCTVVSGFAASMGAFLAAAGTKGKRFIGENAEMMIHQPLGGAEGQASDIERSARHILKIKEKMNTMLAEFTSQPYEKVCADCERDHYLDAAEAIEYGLADRLFAGFEE